MAKVLGYSLDVVKRSYLANMTLHQGFPVLKELFEEACEQATAEVIKIDPSASETEAAYSARLARMQLTARAIHDFCSSVLRSIDQIKKVSALDVQEEAKGTNALLERVQKSLEE